MSHFSHGFKSVGKAALLSLLVSAAAFAAVGCDANGNPAASTEPPYVTDANGSIVVDATGQPILAEPESVVEIETENYQTLDNSKFDIYDYFSNFNITSAISGKYTNRFNTLVYEPMNVTYYSSIEFQDAYKEKYKDNIKMIDYLQSATTAMNNILQDTNKKFTLNFTLINQPYAQYALVIDDQNQVLAITVKDVRTHNQAILNGIVGNNYYTSSTNGIMQIVTEETQQTVKSYLQEHQFSDLTSSVFAYLLQPMSTLLRVWEEKSCATSDSNTILICNAYSGEGGDSIYDQQLNSLSVYGVEFSEKNELVGIYSLSKGYLNVVNDKIIEVPVYAKIFDSTYNEGVVPQFILDALQSDSAQEVTPEQ